MSVLINSQSGLAEDVPQEQADLLLQQGSHELPFVNAQGEHFTAPLGQAGDLLKQGYSQPSPEQLQDLLKTSKYSSTGEQLKTFGEGVGEGVAGPLFTGAERMLGGNPESMRSRQEINPGLHGLGQAVGLGTSALVGTGEAALLDTAGEAAVKTILPDVYKATRYKAFIAPPLVQRAAATAVKQMAEMAVLQGSDEISKGIMAKPGEAFSEDAISSAIVDIGLSGLLGGAVGGGAHLAAEPLWTATKGTKLAQMLSMIKDKASAPESAQIASDMAKQSGLSLSPEMQAAIGKNEEMRGFAQALRESGTKSGEAFRQIEEQDKLKASKAIIESLGKTEADLGADLSHNVRGAEIKDTLNKELKAAIDPITEQYKPIEKKLATIELTDTDRDAVAEQLHQLGIKEGYDRSKSSEVFKSLENIIKELPDQSTLEDLRKYQSRIRESLGDNYRAAKQMIDVFRDSEESILKTRLGAEAPELLAQHEAARAGYRANMNLLDSLNDRLHVGKYYGPASFLKNLSEMTPESVLNRLRGSKDADLLKLLNDQLPETAKGIRSHVLDELLQHTDSQGRLNTRTLYRTLDKMSPEMRAFALPPSAQDVLDKSRDFLQSIPERINPSGTGRMLDTLWKKMPGGAGAMISALMGHNPVAGYLIGQASQFVGREAPDAMKLAMLKFMGSEAPISAPGFKALFKYAESAYKGAQALEKASKAVFKEGSEVVPLRLLPSPKQEKTIEKSLKVAQTDPGQLLNASGDLAHYMPDHATDLSATAGRAASYLNSLRPNTDKPGVLDATRQPNDVEQAQYKRALGIIQQPMLVLQHIKEGTLTPKDIETLNSVHPGVYNTFKNKLTSQLMDHVSKGNAIPYKTQMGLSMFLAQPLASSMMPTNMLSNQGLYIAKGRPQQPQGRPSKGSPKALSELPGIYQTPEQARSQVKLARK